MIFAIGSRIGVGIGVAIAVTIGVTIGVSSTPCCSTMPTSLTSTSGTALTIVSTGNDADNRGIQVHSLATGLSAMGVNVLCDGAATSTICVELSCINGVSSSRAYESSDGNVLLHGTCSAQCNTKYNKAATFAANNNSTVTIGTATTNVLYQEAHLSTPTLNAACQSGGGQSVVGSNVAMTLTVGATATTCNVSFSAPVFSNPPTCRITARTGTNQATLAYSTSNATLTMSAVSNAGVYDITCTGH